MDRCELTDLFYPRFVLLRLAYLAEFPAFNVVNEDLKYAIHILTHSKTNLLKQNNNNYYFKEQFQFILHNTQKI